MDQLIKDIESRKNGEKFHDFCMDDAIFHLVKAREILEADPEDWFNQQREVSKLFVQFLPFFVASSCMTSNQSDQ